MQNEVIFDSDFLLFLILFMYLDIVYGLISISSNICYNKSVKLVKSVKFHEISRSFMKLLK